MSKKVRCISPHGGLREGHKIAGIPPSEHGYVTNSVLGTVEVGTEVDAPDDFVCDGFHFELAQAPPPPAPPAPVPPVATEGTD